MVVLITRMHSSRMRTAHSSNRQLGGLPLCMLGYTHPPPRCGPGDPPGFGPGDPLGQTLNLPPVCGPGDLQGMQGYHPPPLTLDFEALKLGIFGSY